MKKRKVENRLNARIAAWESIKPEQRKGYRKPGSRNENK